MATEAEAWFLYAGDPDGPRVPAELRRERFSLAPVEDDELLLEPLYGSWEANMSHALQRDPIDICHRRREPRVVIGNSGVYRVLQVGAGVKGIAPGDIGISAELVVDRWGYPIEVQGYDARGTMGCLATRIKAKATGFYPIPESTQHQLAQWAAFEVRYITAWSNLELAYATLRQLIPAEEMARIHVWGWGGGTTFAELALARRLHDCKVAMLSASPARFGLLEAEGIAPVDRRGFGDLDFPGPKAEPEQLAAYKRAEAAFLAEVERRTDGDGVQIFVDMIGGPVQRATCKALGRVSVLTTAGWKLGMTTSYMRALECIDRRQHIHTHFARAPQIRAAIDYGERSGWMPPIDARIYDFDEVPELARDYANGRTGMFPCFRINPV